MAYQLPNNDSNRRLTMDEALRLEDHPIPIPAPTPTPPSPTPTPAPSEGSLDVPVSWMYRHYFMFFGWVMPYFASPEIQITIVSLVCFCCPGMFNALNGLGGAGLATAVPADMANTALYASFTIACFFACTIANWLGNRWSLFLGTLGYALYNVSFLVYQAAGDDRLVIPSGSFLGITAGLLWTVQGGMMMSYPAESAKGRFIAWFWGTFNMGGVVGSLVCITIASSLRILDLTNSPIPLAENIDETHSGSTTLGTYIGILIIVLLGSFLSMFIVETRHVVRRDGSRVIMQRHPTFITEVKGMWLTITGGLHILFLLPMFFTSNWFYTYQFNGYNAARFNVRARCVNNTIYWVGQILGAFSTGYALDARRARRSTKAKAALVLLFVFTSLIWGASLVFENMSPTRAATESPGFVKIDVTHRLYPLLLLLYTMYGFYDAMWQTCVYWFMGSLTNSSRKSNNYAGFYKGFQSAGAAIIWRLDATGLEYKTEMVVTWILLSTSIFFAAPVIFTKIKDTTPIQQDLEDLDINEDDVSPQPAERRYVISRTSNGIAFRAILVPETRIDPENTARQATQAAEEAAIAIAAAAVETTVIEGVELKKKFVNSSMASGSTLVHNGSESEDIADSTATARANALARLTSAPPCRS